MKMREDKNMGDNELELEEDDLGLDALDDDPEED